VTVLVVVVVGFVVVVGRVIVVRVGVGILGVTVHRGVGFWQEQKGHFVPVLTIPDGQPIAHIVSHETVEDTQVTVLVDVVVGFVVSVGRVRVTVVGVGVGVHRGVRISQVQNGQEVPVICWPVGQSILQLVEHASVDARHVGLGGSRVTVVRVGETN
jgi:hypothetical protein